MVELALVASPAAKQWILIFVRAQGRPTSRGSRSVGELVVQNVVEIFGSEYFFWFLFRLDRGQTLLEQWLRQREQLVVFEVLVEQTADVVQTAARVDDALLLHATPVVHALARLNDLVFGFIAIDRLTWTVRDLISNSLLMNGEKLIQIYKLNKSKRFK